MADSPEAADALAKREAEVPASDPIVSWSTSGIMLVCALLLLFSLAWSLYDEAIGQRPWKNLQREFVARYDRYLNSIKDRAGQGEEAIKSSPEYQALDADAAAVKEKVRADLDQIDAEVKQLQPRLDAVTEPFQNQRGKLTVINFNIEQASGSAKDKYRKQAEEKRNETVAVDMPADDNSGKTTVVKMNYATLEKTYNDLREQKAKLLGDKAEKSRESQELAKKRDDYLKNHLTILTPGQIDGVKKGLKSFDYSILGHQVSVNEYNIADRCEVCHLGVRSPLTIKAEDMAPGGPGKNPDNLARAFVSHPSKELLDIHKPDRFGCSSCHWGNGRATTGEEKAHGLNKFWLWPMFEKENTEAGCQQCHAKDRVTQGAETLNLGRDLFSQRGCMGCHRYEGFDRETDALTNTRQLVSQLEDQITANNKVRGQDAEAATNAADDAEALRYRNHAESLLVTNSLLAARIDQLNQQSKYLMQDQKKVGPNLKDVRLKLAKEWIPEWLKDPQAFRPGTKMPTFWRFAKDENGDDEIKAISAYLWQTGFDGKTPDQQKGDVNNGKDLFETKGCLACHSLGAEDNKVGGTFAANLSRVGEKANFEYIVRWIHNPRERWAPYCPKHKRDLTADDYKQAGKPFVFDTELHSKCPIDGAELQVQNMTVMPNFRLSETEARDIATYLFSLSARPGRESTAFMDDPNLKEQGRQLIKQFGCAGCHEINGFEEEQRIGKELTVEGATPLERLDFATSTQDAEQGRDPLFRELFPDRKEQEWYTHKGFFEHKLADPSIYDKGKEKDPKDRLRMPKPYLTDQWRNALTTFLLGSVGTEGANVPKSLFYDPLDQRRQDIQNGWWLIKKYNCVGCHQVQVGQRSILMDLAQYSTPEGKDLLPPRLTSEGARVDPNWLLRFLHDPSLSVGQALAATPAAQNNVAGAAAPAGGQGGDKYPAQPGADRNGVRPYLKVRMPTFNFSPNELQTLVRFFMALSGQQEPYIKEQLDPLTEQDKLVAREMFTSGTPCLKCHITGEPAHDAKAIAPNFLLASERLKPEWTFRWLLDPSQISPGTAMPSGLFKKDGERWAVNLPQPPKDVSDYHGDHARLLVRYMFLMSPDEQRRLLSASPAPAAAATAQPAVQKAHANKRRVGSEIGWFTGEKTESPNPVASLRFGRAVARAPN